jgi:CheY-like chemotaxis protein
MVEDVVLQVEDDEASYFVFRALFQETCPDIRLERAQDGEEALTMIRNLVADPAVRLALVLMDVFLPFLGGWEVLATLRADESLRQVQVVMFTGQILERDRLRCAALDVEYIEKPSDLQGLVSLVKEICARVGSIPVA